MDPEGVISTVRKQLAGARVVAALTGAGISAESGVPTFRGKEGLWRKYRSEDLATPEAFRRDPRLVWEWYHWRRGLIAETSPNPGHRALADLDRTSDFTLITQNVDGLHTLAGSRRVLEVHGCIWRLLCTACGDRREDRSLDLAPLPACPTCGGLLRPDVVWFGEPLDQRLLGRAFDAASRSEVFLVVGTSAVVQPAASLAWQAKRSGAFVVEINLEKTAFSSQADATLIGPAGVILPQLVD